jgi:hypothetical protein
MFIFLFLFLFVFLVSLAVPRSLEIKIKFPCDDVKIFFQKKFHSLKDFSLHLRATHGAAWILALRAI